MQPDCITRDGTFQAMAWPEAFLPKETVKKIACLARVPDVQKTFDDFELEIRVAVADLWLHLEGEEQYASYSRALNPRCEKAASALAESIRSFRALWSVRFSGTDDLYAVADRADSIGAEFLLEQVEELAEAVAGECNQKRAFLQKRRGRPEAYATNWPFFHFVVSLLDAADHASGRLTFSKAYPKKGSLAQTLDALSPFVPAGLVPRHPPASRLAEICARWRRLPKTSRPEIRP